jgi:LmbE family N-acetylglucosaminyl deacetylase
MSGVVPLLLAPPALLCILVLLGLSRRPRSLDGPTAPALVFAAHPDDCVILAGAYGIRAREEGQTVRVVYLTCGAETPELPRARTRKQEALKAWGSIGVPAEDITFLDRPEHGVDAVFTWDERDRATALSRIEESLRAMPTGATVFIPAAGEAHVDHRVLRQVTLEAWQRSGRTDLKFMEGPEYNAYLSVVQSPAKVWQTMLPGIPGMSRLVDSRRSAWAGFPSGNGSSALPPRETRLERRRELLRAFSSENGELLVRLFGWYERYRSIKDPERGLADEPPRGYLKVGDRQRGFSALLALLVLAEIAAVAAAVAAAVLASAVTRGFAGAVWLRAGVVVLAAGAFVLGARRRTMVETRAFYWGLAAGAVIGALR